MSYRFALLGDPVNHSRSPVIHRTMFEISGLDGEYWAVRADRAGLVRAVEELRAGGWDGLNITMPLKGDAARLADEVDAGAVRSASVNTLSRRGSVIHGHSSDMTTFRDLLSRPGLDSLPVIHVLGAGGSAAAALAGIGETTVYVSARRREQAEELASRFAVLVVPWGSVIAGALVINTTPIGMSGEHLPAGLVESAAALIDLPYGPDPTPAVRAAESLGLPFVDGHEFLIRQASTSFFLWTGVEVNSDSVVEALRKT